MTSGASRTGYIGRVGRRNTLNAYMPQPQLVSQQTGAHEGWQQRRW